MPELRLISGDSHFIEPADLWSSNLGDRFGDRTPRVIDEYMGRKGRFLFTGGQVSNLAAVEAGLKELGEWSEAGSIPELRLRFQRAAGLTAEVMNPTFTMSIMRCRTAGSDSDVVRACAAVYNDWAAEFCSSDWERLIGIAAIPTDDVDWSVSELTRIRNRGLRGALIQLEPPSGSPPYHSEDFDPLWAAAQDLDIPLALHIGVGSLPDPFHLHTAEERANAPRAMMQVWNDIGYVLANEFIFGTILDRFPRLKLICGEFEVSWLPTFMYRIDQMQDDFSSRLNLPALEHAASDYVRNRIYHGLIDDPYWSMALSVLGPDRLVWGSDFPHIRAIGVDAPERVSDLFQGMSVADQRCILADNALKLFSA